MKTSPSGLILAFLTLLLSSAVSGQGSGVARPVYNPNPPREIRSMAYIADGGDTIGYINWGVVAVYSSRSSQKTYNRLVYNVKVVYPIAKYANVKLQEMEAHLKTLKSKRDREKYTKQVEADLKAAYTPILKRMSLTQGKILIKLIDRQTGSTSYELVKELRGSFSAFFMQGLARMFGANLKDSYDAAGEDQMIENIIRMYEAGMI